MGSGQVVSLLAEDNRYLVQICQKGMKGADYSKVLAWYDVAILHVAHLARLLSEEQVGQKSLFKTLNIFKAGFYSDDKEVQSKCSEMFTMLINEFNQSKT
jgi:hypothetical protein